MNKATINTCNRELVSYGYNGQKKVSIILAPSIHHYEALEYRSSIGYQGSFYTYDPDDIDYVIDSLRSGKVDEIIVFGHKVFYNHPRLVSNVKRALSKREIKLYMMDMYNDNYPIYWADTADECDVLQLVSDNGAFIGSNWSYEDMELPF